MKRVSELITTDTARNFADGDVITIKAGTGVGKSYWVKNILYLIAKENNEKILFLIHRVNCVDQFKDEIIKDKKTDVIDIRTYQKLESLYNNQKKIFDFSEYKYIVCDEFHYFMSDAAYNKTTDISLNLILTQDDKVKIFMSATGDYMKGYINEIKKIKTIDYELPIKFDFIKNLTFFNKDETLEKFIEEAIRKGDKSIFFIQSATKAYNLYKKYKKYCLFNCGKSDKHYKYVDVEKIDNMLKNERFDKLILITTTCMDAGVNINDEEVKHIVCDVKDLGVLIQCIGRKRIQSENDKIYLYIKTITNKQLGGMKRQLNTKIDKAKYLKTHTVKEYIEQYPRQNDYNNIVYSDTVEEDDKSTHKVNELMYFKCLVDGATIDTMLAYKQYGYCKYLANLLGFIDDEGYFNYRLIDEDYKKKTLEEYLNNAIGKKLYKNDQHELAKTANIKRNGKLLKSAEALNSCFKEERIPFIIDNNDKNIDWTRKLEDGTENPYRGKKYWMIYKLVFS
ncbi:DNA helicase [Anaerophilus nitritogenes]|uniref:DNA helicase n=1 Tax=Anaerophilus nitritogenes TaxID=2498136 RepID=UPI00101B63E4|nr:DNA helicase [Anaerophilus nitritogenes]